MDPEEGLGQRSAYSLYSTFEIPDANENNRVLRNRRLVDIPGH
jgi:hypothetical protein